jgi:hypothetical protein
MSNTGKGAIQMTITEMQNRGEGNFTVPSAHQHGGESDVNQVVRIITNDRELNTGESTFHIDENQSDWNQALRKQGTRAQKEEDISVLDASVEHLEKEHKDIMDKWQKEKDAKLPKRELTDFTSDSPEEKAIREKYAPRTDEIQDELEALRIERARLVSDLSFVVPDAPFKDSWAMLGFKQALQICCSRCPVQRLMGDAGLQAGSPDRSGRRV